MSFKLLSVAVFATAATKVMLDVQSGLLWSQASWTNDDLPIARN